MPVHKQGSGFQWGGHGKVYTGKDAKKKAYAQARAAYSNGYRDPGMPRVRPPMTRRNYG